MITTEQKTLLLSILGQDASESDVLDLHIRIKREYVKHSPTEFRISVGHGDLDRFPGALGLAVGDVVNLVSNSTERYIPVEIIETPATPHGYYRGVITQQLVKGSRFEVGDSVLFSEDQVRATPRMKRSLK